MESRFMQKVITQKAITRCSWCGDDKLYQQYHDREWGVPQTREQTLFEFLILEGMQAGLSWITILKKRPALRAAFANFNIRRLAQYKAQDVARCMQNPNIIRHQLKIESAISNAQAYLAMRETGLSLKQLSWQFTDNRVVVNRWRRHGQIPATTPASEQLSKALKKLGFRFVGPTICYAYMQAVGIVNDHVVDCYRHQECVDLSEQMGEVAA